MLNIYNENTDLIISDTWWNKITLNKDNCEVILDNFEVTYPWEYEKSWILLEVKEWQKKLFYNFLVEGVHVVIINDDTFELKEEILSFFGDVDILVIKWSKAAAKIYENIEAKVVVPYWEEKDIFLNTLWQHVEEIEEYKKKWDFHIENTEFVNLK